jgi:hypothetical protein
MSNVVKLPSAAPSYFTVRRSRRGWSVLLVTPAGPREIVTALATATSYGAAVAEAERIAARQQRPLRLNLRPCAPRAAPGRLPSAR